MASSLYSILNAVSNPRKRTWGFHMQLPDTWKYKNVARRNFSAVGVRVLFSFEIFASLVLVAGQHIH
jgi:hypothetical protein